MIRLSILIFTVLLSLSNVVYSATYTTTAVPGVWSPAGAPESGDILIINHNWSAYNFTFADNAINPTSNGDITVNNGGAIKINSALTISGNTDLIVEANGSFVTTGSFVINGAAGTKRFDGYISNAGAVLNGATITGNGTWDFAGAFQNNGSINGFTTNPTFSPFSIADPNNAPILLPVTLINFEIKQIDDKILISWTTTHEVNNEHFILYRRNNFNDFEPIAKIKGNGNSAVKIHYTFQDENFKTGWNDYKLKQVDYDGALEYFSTKSIYVAPKFTVYPIPSSDFINIHLESVDYNLSELLKIYDINGSLVYQTLLDKNLNKLNISNLNSGIYTLMINGIYAKLIIQK